MTVPTKGSDEEHKVPPIISDDSANSRSPASNKKKKNLTPYTLYMRENYVTLKKKCNDDKKAIFSMCHEMWENESNDVKTLYERKANEENEEGRQNETALTVITGITDDMELLDSTPKIDTSVDSMDDAGPRNLYMTNRSLNLESAVQFASLVAAYHIDVSTRDRAHIDLSRLLDKAIVFPATLEEI
jgi:hypothetical protein